MSKINGHNKIIVFGVIVIFIGLTIAPGVTHTMADENNTGSNIKTMTFSQEFSAPLVTENDQYTSINVNEASSFVTNPSEPRVPVLTKTFEFPFGTKIVAVNYLISDVKTTSVSKKIEPVSSPQWLDNNTMVEKEGNPAIYNSYNIYPSDWLSYRKGCGINENGDHVLYLSINIYPVRYTSGKNTIEYINEIQITVKYEETESNIFKSGSTYDLVIIAPSQYSSNLQPLVDNKNKHGVKTNITTLDDIYGSFPGRDEAEQIKYFIKYALENWDTKYVLLVGDIEKLPIRAAYSYPWGGGNEGGYVLSDLYYADIYDANYSFCSWDANGNNTFGEIEYNMSSYPPEMNDVDGVDLYPDVNLGRLACVNSKEVDIVVNNTINYEENTSDQIWFQKIILVGGDTFPLARGGAPFVYEGEITNIKVAQELPDFKHIILWSSRHNLNALTFNRAVSRGAGFVSYSGHGFEYGWGTYRPNAISKKRMIYYFTPYTRGLRNYDKLPIIFFDACLTARFDFNMSILNEKFPLLVKLITILNNGKYDPSEQIPCLAWSFMNKADRGAVATVGATRSAYTSVDKDGVYAGAGYLNVHFFKSYHEGVTAGEMLTGAQNDYINNVGKDYFTIEEFLLLGDPSLMASGYP